MGWFDGIDQVVKYIENNLTKEIDYDEIAKLLGYSSYHCQRLFLLMAGKSPADYTRYRRLSVAAEELMQSDEKIIDIALKYGYGSPNSFIRAFK